MLYYICVMFRSSLFYFFLSLFRPYYYLFFFFLNWSIFALFLKFSLLSHCFCFLFFISWFYLWILRFLSCLTHLVSVVPSLVFSFSLWVRYSLPLLPYAIVYVIYVYLYSFEIRDEFYIGGGNCKGWFL